MSCAHLGGHTNDLIVLIQFHRNYKNGLSAGVGREIFLSVCFYILVCGAAECDGCQSLAIFDGYFIAGNTYLSCTTGPGEFVRSVNTVFQLSFAVYLTGGTAGIGL